jgi:tetratricopeptide (TPR) repeat protein
MAEQMRSEVSERWSLCLDTLLLPGRQDFWTAKVYAGAYSDTGNPVIAERFYRRGLEQDPSNAQFHNNLGVLLWKQGKDGVPHLQAALEHDSTNSIVLYNLGVALYDRDSLVSDRYLKEALVNDNYSLRTKPEYNRIIRDFGSTADCWVTDLDSVFEGLSEADFFVDHCHPSQAGHELIAERLLVVIDSILNQRNQP